MNNFLEHLNFINYKFFRYHTLVIGHVGRNRKLKFLVKLVKKFLRYNHLYPKIHPSELANFWMNLFYDNSTNGPSCYITRMIICVTIYVLSMDHDFRGYISGINDNDQYKTDELIGRFKDLISMYNYHIPFLSDLKYDIKKYKGLNNIKGDLNNKDINHFVNKYKDHYKHYFKLDDISSEDQLDLTECALKDLMYKYKYMNKILNGDIRNVD